MSGLDAPDPGEATWTATAALAPGSLVIDRIETIALRAPLGRRFSGSAYSMDNRCTIVVRLTTADGIVAETYSGDTDDEQALIVGIIHDELAPRDPGPVARATPRARWLDDGARDVRHPARPPPRRSRPPVSTPRSGTLSARHSVSPASALGRLGDSLPVITIGGYYGKQDIADEVSALRERGSRG